MFAWNGNTKCVQQRLEAMSLHLKRSVAIRACLSFRQLVGLRQLVSICSRMDHRSAAVAMNYWHLQHHLHAFNVLRQTNCLRFVWSSMRSMLLRSQRVRRLAVLFMRRDLERGFALLMCNAASFIHLASVLQPVPMRNHEPSAIRNCNASRLRDSWSSLISSMLQAWSCMSRAEKVRRRRLRFGLRRLLAYSDERWRKRRQLVLADHLALRRRLRSVWLHWQLFTFAGRPAQDHLLEVWNHAAAAVPSIASTLVSYPGHNGIDGFPF